MPHREIRQQTYNLSGTGIVDGATKSNIHKIIQKPQEVFNPIKQGENTLKKRLIAFAYIAVNADFSRLVIP